MDRATTCDGDEALDDWLSVSCPAFRGLTSRHKLRALGALLEQCDSAELWEWQAALTDRLCRDLVGWLPLELSHHILGYLDTESLFRAAAVSSLWRRRVDSALTLWRSQVALLGGTSPRGDDAENVQVRQDHKYSIWPFHILQFCILLLAIYPNSQTTKSLLQYFPH